MFFGIVTCFNVFPKNSYDCSGHYENINKVDDQLRQIKSAFLPLNSEKYNYLIELENKKLNITTSGFNGQNGAVLKSYQDIATRYFTDPDYPQFQIIKAIDDLLEKVSLLKKRSWAADKINLDKMASNTLTKSDFYSFSDTPLIAIQNYYFIDEQLTNIFSEFLKFSDYWVINHKIISVEAIKAVKFNYSNRMVGTFSIAHCQLSYLNRQTQLNLSK